MTRHTSEILERSRRTRERSRQLQGELRQTVARSLVLLWHSQRYLPAPATPPQPTHELASRAERAKRNRELVVRNAAPPPPARRIAA